MAYSDEKLQDYCLNAYNKISKLQSEKPEWSIIFPALNEEWWIHKIIDSILNLNIPDNFPIEIIWVDNWSTDRTGEILRICWIKVVYEQKKWIRFARRAWLEESKWKIIFQTDSDVKLWPLWLSKHLSHYLWNNNIIWVWWLIRADKVSLLYRIIELRRLYLQKNYKWSNIIRIWWANASFIRELWINININLLPEFWEDRIFFSELNKISPWKVINDVSNEILCIVDGRRFKTNKKVIEYIFRKKLKAKMLWNYNIIEYQKII